MKSKSPHRVWAGAHALSPIDLTGVQRPSQIKGKAKEKSAEYHLQQSATDSHLSSPQLSSRPSPTRQLLQEKIDYQLGYHQQAPLVEQQVQQMYSSHLAPLPPSQQPQQQNYNHTQTQIPYPEHYQPQQSYSEPSPSQNQLPVQAPQLPTYGHQPSIPRPNHQERQPPELASQPIVKEQPSFPPSRTEQLAQHPNMDEQDCRNPKCQQLRFRIQLLELQLQGQRIQDIHYRLPTYQPGQLQSQPHGFQSQDGTAYDSGSDDDGSEKLKLGMQKELQEHVVQLQMQNPIPIHTPIPVSFIQPALLTMPTPTFSPAQPPLDTQTSNLFPAQSTAPAPMQMSTPAPSYASSHTSQTVSQASQAPTQASVQPTISSYHLGPSQLPPQALTPGCTPMLPTVPMQMHEQLPDQVPTLLPPPCCLKTCTVAHHPWTETLKMDANSSSLPELEAFDFTTVLFEKYDKLYDRLAVVDSKMAELGRFQKPRAPGFKRRPIQNVNQGQVQGQTGAITLMSAASQPQIPAASVASTAISPPPVPSSNTQGSTSPTPMTDEDFRLMFKRTMDRYLHNLERMARQRHNVTVAAERGKTVEEVEKESSEMTNAFAYKCFFLEMDRRRIVELWTERDQLLDKLASLERDMEKARDDGLMPWAKNS